MSLGLFGNPEHPSLNESQRILRLPPASANPIASATSFLCKMRDINNENEEESRKIKYMDFVAKNRKRWEKEKHETTGMNK